MIGFFLFFSLLVAKDSKTVDSTPYPMKEGIYQLQSQTIGTPRYPNGKTETGTRKVRNEVMGQKWVTDTVLTYTDSNNQPFQKAMSYETTFFKDFNGQQRVFEIGSQGGYMIGTLTMEKDGGYTIEAEGMSNALGKMVKTRVVANPTKKGYSNVQTYYDETTKKWVPLRTSTFTLTSQSSN